MSINVTIFSTQDYDKTSFSPLLASRDVTITWLPTTLTIDTVQLAAGAHTVCVFVNDSVDSEVLCQLQAMGVKHVALRCAGYNNVDIDSASKLGIAISRVPAYSPAAVAEHALALIMTLNRKTHKAYNRVREGNFDLNGLQGFTLQNKTVGVIGTGNIGAAFVKLLSGFGCHINCFDPYPQQTLVDSYGANYVSLDTLFTDSDIISLHCPLNEQSHHLINTLRLTQMKDGVMLINTSRGGLIDTHAVIEALKTHKIGYLGLDVYEMESELFFRDHSGEIIQDDVFERLATFHNVLITGHQGFFTHEALAEIAKITLENIEQFVDGVGIESRFVVHP